MPFEGQILIRVFDNKIGRAIVHDLNIVSMTGEVVEKDT